MADELCGFYIPIFFNDRLLGVGIASLLLVCRPRLLQGWLASVWLCRLRILWGGGLALLCGKTLELWAGLNITGNDDGPRF